MLLAFFEDTIYIYVYMIHVADIVCSFVCVCAYACVCIYVCVCILKYVFICKTERKPEKDKMQVCILMCMSVWHL